MPSSNTSNVRENSAAFLLSKSFLKRSLTTMILLPIGLWILVLGYPYSLGLFILFWIGFLYEWLALVGSSTASGRNKALWFIGGALYISSGLWGFYYFYSHALLKSIVLLIVIWVTDIGAYFIGQLCGGPKLWPTVSPKKTWSGAIGGTVAATFVIIGTALFFEPFRPLILFYIALSIVGQIGDLIESYVKRSFHVKDTGTLLPGHGGLLDRFDSTLAVGIVLWFV